MYDISNLRKLKRLDDNSPEAMKAFWAFDGVAFAPGAIDVLSKQLIAVAVALTTQCPYCIELHVKSARNEGATDEMLTERSGRCCRDACRRRNYARVSSVQGVGCIVLMSLRLFNISAPQRSPCGVRHELSCSAFLKPICNSENRMRVRCKEAWLFHSELESSVSFAVSAV